jgi:hypothetical protein
MIALLAALSLALAPAPSGAPDVSPAQPSKHIVKIMARGDGRSAETAYKVSSIRDEYEIARALGLEVTSQGLVSLKRPYDVLTVRDPRDGSTREIWFDIGSFFPGF